MNELSVSEASNENESESFDFIWEEWEEYKGDIPLWQHIFCGSIAGLMEHVFMYPLDTIKTYFQTNTNLNCKKSFKKCNLYNCHNNIKELNTPIHIDKRNFCSAVGCDNCLNKTCNYENYCNIKTIPCENKRIATYINILDILKKKNKLNRFHHDNYKLYNSKINHIVNKKLQYHNYCNKRINRYSNNYKCFNSYYKYLLNLKKNGTNLCINSKEINSNKLYNCKNKRINYLKRNMNNLENYSGKDVMIKLDKLSNIYKNNVKNGIKKLSYNDKKQLSLLSLRLKEKKMYSSKKVASKIILKKIKKKYKGNINYYKYSFNNNNTKNYGNKKLRLLNTYVNIKQNNYVYLKNNNFIFNKYMGKFLKIEGNNRFISIFSKNKLTLMNNLKNIYIHIINKCFNTNNFNNNNKSKYILKFPHQNFLYDGNKNTYKTLNNTLNFLKKTNYHNLNNIFKKSFIYQNYLNILNTQKRKNHLNVFVNLFQNMKNFLNHVTHKNISLENNKIIKKNDIFSFLNNERNILLNNIYYFPKNNNTYLFDRNINFLSKFNLYKNNNTNLFDRNIHSSSKFNFYKKNTYDVNRFNNSFKNFSFFKNIFLLKNKKNDVNVIRYNCNLIRNNFSHLYKGVNVVMLGCIPAHALYFSTFEYSKKYFSSISNNSSIRILNNKKPESINYKLNDLNYFSIIVSGFLATIAHDLIITPIDTLKQRIQLGINRNGLESIKILKENGIRSLYLSLPITLLMNIPYQIIMICTNERMKKFYFEYICNFSNINKNSSENKYNKIEDNNIKKKHNKNIEGNIKNVSIINDLKNNHEKNYYENNNADKIINNLNKESDKMKLIKFYIDQDLYSLNNSSKNKESKFVQGDEVNEEKIVKTLSNEKHNSDILFKEIIKKLENNCNNHPESCDNKIRNSLNFEQKNYIDLKNIWMNNYKNDSFSKHFNHITSYFVCAGIGGGIAAILTNPFDVIKTRIQTECFNTKGFQFFKVVSNLYYKEGLGSFFKGSLARMALCIPASAISWGSYETMKRFFKINFNSI
ncbi:mitochondrial carrier protein, putative [Plasmodium gallinaceum]|uniref:Mitochondrial carrier protein, putative n=1 Tax=Plasmodium gallinaceum TaxID=5849 RepID=A0A1J1H001_PLAGA|nr:mitochondrial carrier protein, putative [Plasmodium gallinaceum]CRG96596.1 mitochondrial carrier protein, putative [Plasmodium gallinaceum]